ncbi:MAG: glycosyltransferase [Deltaproteobacteria bacterium]|nr:glycosyltransferase [Deltaproteobacteria bacterium]
MTSPYPKKPARRSSLAYFPDWSHYNPYQALLYSAVSKFGISCTGFSGNEFTLKWLLRYAMRFKTIHLHWLSGICRENGRDISGRYLLQMYGKILTARLLGCRVLWTVHNVLPHEASGSHREIRLRHLVGKSVNKVLVHCRYAKDLVSDAWGVREEKIVVVPHGAYTESVSEGNDRVAARKRLNIEGGKFAFLFFGMIREYKGVVELVRAFADIAKADDNVHLVIAGEPQSENLKTELEDTCRDGRVSLSLFRIPDADVPVYFNAADVVVLPYAEVLTSGTALLAFSLGKGIIAPEMGCLPELVTENTAILYKSKDQLKEAMVAAIGRMNRPTVREEALKIARSLQWDDIVRKHFMSLL